MNKRELLDTLDRSFGNEDAQELVFELGLDWHNLPGESKRARLRALIEECLRGERIDELIAAASARRPAAIPPGTSLAEGGGVWRLPGGAWPPRAQRLTWLSGAALVLVAALVVFFLIGRSREKWPPASPAAPAEVGPGIPSPAPTPTPTHSPELPETAAGALPEAPPAAAEGAACPSPAAPPADLEAMASVAGASSFLIGDSRSASTNGKPLAHVTVTAYLIDRHEVTFRQYRDFIAATGHPPPEEWDEDFLAGKDYLPVTGVTWQDAADYCAWRGKRLPTQEEWELACRGAAEGRLYPWGDDWDACRANTRERGLGSAWTVGSAPGGDSPYGASDMAGNVAEWTSSLSDGAGRVVRGGSWTDSRAFASCVERTQADPEWGYGEIGFRCARDAPP